MAKQTIAYIPKTLDLVLYAGDGVKFNVIVSNAALEAVDLTGTMIAQIRTSREASDPPKAEFDIDLADAANGIAALSLSGAETHSLITGDETFEGVWDLQWTASGDEPMTLCQGKVECVPDVSH